MNYANVINAEQISKLWQLASKMIEENGEIEAPIVFVEYQNQGRYAVLNGSKFDSEEEFVVAIRNVVDTIEAQSAMMISSAIASQKKKESESDLNVSEIVLFFYRTKEVEVQQVALVHMEKDGEKTLGELRDLNKLVKNEFLDGLFQSKH